jgi:hypothetical protein
MWGQPSRLSRRAEQGGLFTDMGIMHAIGQMGLGGQPATCHSERSRTLSEAEGDGGVEEPAVSLRRTTPAWSTNGKGTTSAVPPKP